MYLYVVNIVYVLICGEYIVCTYMWYEYSVNIVYALICGEYSVCTYMW